MVSIKVSDLETILSIPIANIILVSLLIISKRELLVNKVHPVFKQHPEFRSWEGSGILTKPLDTIVCPWPLEMRNRYIFQWFQTLGPLHNFYFRYGEYGFKKFHNKLDLAKQIGQCTDMKAVI